MLLFDSTNRGSMILIQKMNGYTFAVFDVKYEHLMQYDIYKYLGSCRKAARDAHVLTNLNSRNFLFGTGQRP
jgi:hypothetical protein